jgi:hypothetical protein
MMKLGAVSGGNKVSWLLVKFTSRSCLQQLREWCGISFSWLSLATNSFSDHNCSKGMPSSETMLLKERSIFCMPARRVADDSLISGGTYERLRELKLQVLIQDLLTIERRITRIYGSSLRDVTERQNFSSSPY